MTKKTLFTSFFVLIGAGLVGFASCTNEDESVKPSTDEKVAWTFEIGANGGSRTQLDANNNVVFKKGDSISVFNNLEAGVPAKAGGDKFTAGNIEGDTASVAKFNGEANISAQNFWILYPYQSDASCNTSGVITATIPAEQTATAGTFDPKANLSVATTEAEPADVPKFYLKNAVGLLKFSVDKAYDQVVICGALGEKIAGKVTIDAATAGITNTDNATDCIVMDGGLEPGKVYYAAVIPQEYKDGMSFKFYNGGTLAGRVRVLNPSQVMEIKRSKILNVGTVKPEVPKMLTGKFSVSAGKQVIFSPGNLLAIWNGTGYDWGFEERQWDFVGDETRYDESNGNKHIDGDGKNSLYAMVDLFGWTGSSAGYTDGRKQYGINTSQTSGDYGSSGDDTCCNWGSLVSDATTWRTLSSAEWGYLLSTRKVTVSGSRKASYGEGTVNNVKGLIILPDNWDGSVGSFTYGSTSYTNNTFSASSSPTWSVMESAGCVFLPCAGTRNGNTLINVGSYGYYWSSSPNASNAPGLYFYSGSVKPQNNYLRSYGRSVRLVCASE